MNALETDKPRNSIKANERAVKVVAKAPMANAVCLNVSSELRCDYRNENVQGSQECF
jgi:hypothetical protein